MLIKTKLSLLSLVVSLSVFFSCSTEKRKEIKEDKVKVAVVNTFNYQPKKLVNGKLKAVIELGASGFNSFVINVDAEKNWEIVSKEYGKSLILDGEATVKGVNSILDQYLEEIKKLGVKGEDVHFVVSSGAEKEELSTIIKEELRKKNLKITVVTAEDEGKYALKSVLPAEFNETAFVVDIGSGNTKISYLNKDEIFAVETYGSKYFKKGIPSNKVYDEVSTIAKNIPSEKRNVCFIIGGVPYQMAKKQRVNKERFTTLNKDVNFYNGLIEKKGDKVKSGLTIFKAINDTTTPNTIVFDWDANFTIGFLLDLKH
ncbi:ROK family protein [uncultured Tenacibaculum sp.]|uniref:ROK family protein n=1 Tax=uncultured Tenacibaculum sp. TaxID=174713 RepID=UPI002618D655|nr:ROK family protein [uncultured Tenacibaculum sp.]